MIRKVYMDGQVSTLLVIDDNNDENEFNPVLQALKEQAERIENLETQNRELLKREEFLISLIELTNKTGELMSKNLEAIERLESSLNISEKNNCSTDS